MGLLNTAGAVGGFLTPAVVGYLTYQNVGTKYRKSTITDFSLTDFSANNYSMAKGVLDFDVVALCNWHSLCDIRQI